MLAMTFSTRESASLAILSIFSSKDIFFRIVGVDNDIITAKVCRCRWRPVNLPQNKCFALRFGGGTRRPPKKLRFWRDNVAADIGRRLASHRSQADAAVHRKIAGFNLPSSKSQDSLIRSCA